jgi:tetratricopeptide (TPR) repeat protein
VLFLQIKQAECALADGRLDEAFEIAKAEDIRRHRHGQTLIGRLTRALVQRGQTSLQAGQLQPALADCNKAEKLGGNLSEIAQLRAAVCDAILKQQEVHQQEAVRLAQAKRQIAGGWLSVGGKILEEAPPDDAQAKIVQQELQAARLQSEDALSKAEQALQQGDVEAAVDLFQAARLQQNRNGQVGDLLRRIRIGAAKQVRTRFEQGRIDHAASLLQRLSPLGQDGEEIADLRKAVTHCHQAAELVAEARPGEALPLLRRVKAICPSAAWLDKTMTDVRKAAEALEDLDSGPLGLSIADASHCRLQIADRGLESMPMTNPQSEIPSPRSEGVGFRALPPEFVMQMDGIGSFVVFREPRVTLGSISSSTRPTLGLMAEPDLPTIAIERVDGDYFVHADKPIEINGQMVTEKLLADGDRLALSARCRVRFALPNPASTTAVLTLSGARLSRPDIRQIILMGRDILAGPYTTNHIQTEQLEQTITFFAQNDRLLCRANTPVAVGNQPMQPDAGLILDAPIRIGPMSMVLVKFRA